MQIKEIHIKNFLKIIQFDISIVEPVTLIAGSNESGKTSIQEAIRLATTGRFGRIVLKRNYGEIVNDEADECVVSIVGEWMTKDGYAEQTDTFYIRKKDGETKGVPSEKNVPLACILTLDMYWLTSLSMEKRRSVLFELAGVDASMKKIEQKMKKAQITDREINELKPFIKTSFQSAHTFAKEKTSDHRAVWKNIAGETYGSDKASRWKAKVPEGNYDITELPNMETRYTDMIKREGEINNMIRQAESIEEVKDHSEQIETLKEQCKDIDTLREQKTTFKAEKLRLSMKMDDLNEEYARIPIINDQPDPLTCPYCDSAVDYDGAKKTLIKYVDKNLDAAKDRSEANELSSRISHELMTLDNQLSDITGQLTESANALNHAESTRLKIEELELDKPATTLDYDLDEIKAELEQLKIDQMRLNDEIQAQKNMNLAIGRAEERTDKAMAEHKEVERWSYLTEQMSSEGIPGEFLKKGINPINDLLEISAQISGWPRVVINDDMSIEYGFRSYHLLSESAQWKVNAMLSQAIACLNGVKTITFDRVDVLDLKGRNKMLDWCDANYDRYGMQSILFATLKKKPEIERVHSIWLQNGVSI